MQSLKMIFNNGLVVLSLFFGLMLSATAADPGFEDVKVQAAKGDTNAQNLLGLYYREGTTVSQDYEKSFYWYQRAAYKGSDLGQVNVGLAYALGLGVRQDYSKALEWYKKSAKQNNKFSQTAIGIMYEGGQGLRQNRTTAKEWYGKACDNGDQTGCDYYRRLNEQGY